MLQVISKRLILLSLLLFFSYNLKACACSELPPYDEYAFIALVKICDLQLQDQGYNIEFETLEHFKGPFISTCRILSHHPLLINITTSCDLIINTNEEWIICGNYRQQEIAVQLCSKTKLFRNKIGELHYHSCTVNNELHKLQRKFRHYTDLKQDGKHQTFYDSGMIEMEEHYRDGTLDGERFLYYKNGNLRMYQCFSDGLKEEQEFKLMRNGDIEYECEYYKGQAQYYKYHRLGFEVILQEDGSYKRINFHKTKSVR